MGQQSHKLKKLLKEILEGEGADLQDIEYKGNHPKAILSYQGETMKLPVSKSPSDWRAMKNWRCKVRHMLRRVDESHNKR